MCRRHSCCLIRPPSGQYLPYWEFGILVALAASEYGVPYLREGTRGCGTQPSPLCLSSLLLSGVSEEPAQHVIMLAVEEGNCLLSPKVESGWHLHLVWRSLTACQYFPMRPLAALLQRTGSPGPWSCIRWLFLCLQRIVYSPRIPFTHVGRRRYCFPNSFRYPQLASGLSRVQHQPTLL